MRFAEFKILLEAAEGKYYSIGDSHAEGLSYDKRVINYAHGGQPSTSQSNYSGSYKGHPTGIDNVPEGSYVLIAQGANDTANSARAHIDSKGKTPLVPPAKIASNVAAIVSAAKAKKCKVVFVLFPNGNNRAPGLAKYYSGDYQDDVRQAIRAAVGVPVVDLEGKGLSPDGIHGSPGAYLSAAQEAISILGKAPKTEKVEQGSKPTDSKAEQISQLAVPTSRRGPEVADVQKALVALGYPLPKHGVDGIRGPETSGAVKQFQEANNLEVDGDPGPDTVKALSNAMKKKGITIPKSTEADVKTAYAGAYELDDADIKKYGSIPQTKMTMQARESAEKYLGRGMSDDEWDYLLRATAAESAFSVKSYAMVMGSILNRAREYGKNGVIAALMAKNQFQAVTGTAADGHKPSPNFVRGPNDKQLQAMSIAAVEYLPRVSRDQKNFTATNPAAYGPGTNIAYLDQMRKQKGGSEIAGSAFNTTLV